MVAHAAFIENIAQNETRLEKKKTEQTRLQPRSARQSINPDEKWRVIAPHQH